jgi:hypothetical protein
MPEQYQLQPKCVIRAGERATSKTGDMWRVDDVKALFLHLVEREKRHTISLE